MLGDEDDEDGGELYEGILQGGEEPEDEREKSLSQKIYESLGYSKKVLFVLCLGLKGNGNCPLIDIDRSPWSKENKQNVKPSNADLAVEVQRRQRVLEFPGSSNDKRFQMKPKNKKREALIEWLEAYPINQAHCVEFLKKEARRVEDVLQRAITEEKETSLALKHGAWTGPIPYLRLIHCITDCDDTRHAFLHRNDVMERAELDAQGSSERPTTGYEVIAQKWNDPTFNPKTKISSCHDDFCVEHDLSHVEVAHIVPADSVGIKNRLSSIRSVLLRMIQNWEESGQGDGGRRRIIDTEELVEEVTRGEELPTEISIHSEINWGALEGRTQEALDNRANFLQGQPSWYLYFWELADSFQLLASTVQRLSTDVGAAGGSVAAVSSHRKDKKRRHSDVDSSNGDSFDTKHFNLLLERLADGGERDLEMREKALQQEKQLAIQKRIDVLKDKIDELEVELDKNERDVYRRIIDRKKAELQELEEQLDK